ncbi:MAG TPA: cytochrome c oxidase subunit II transmembrane domain-containing protein [Actinomycetota bacterium]|nr:cytochrome c oxidase subunit II transmembrane domain-containing protein [Actinomycetota bacterium]
MRTRKRWVWPLAGLAVIAAACATNAPQDSLNPQGPYADKIYNLFVPVFWIAVAVFVLVEGLLLVFVIRYRRRKNRPAQMPAQIHGNNRLEIAWTILPALILAGVAVPTVTTIFDLAREPQGNTLEVNVLGHQWWWEFDYPKEGITTANELHIPTGRPVVLTLCSVGLGYEDKPTPSDCQPGPPDGAQPAAIGDGVIHSFWVPELAGTQDVVPGQANTLVIEADHPGRYSGQCKEFCGLSHAYMKFAVVAHSPSDYEAWVRNQQADAVTPDPGSLAATGMDLFLNGQCIACHAIQGLEDANGNPVVANGGPNLTHFASRECFAGCWLPNDHADQLARWLDNPAAVKEGSWMPDYGLTKDEIDALVAYLQSLT